MNSPGEDGISHEAAVAGPEPGAFLSLEVEEPAGRARAACGGAGAAVEEAASGQVLACYDTLATANVGRPWAELHYQSRGCRRLPSALATSVIIRIDQISSDTPW